MSVQNKTPLRSRSLGLRKTSIGDTTSKVDKVKTPKITRSPVAIKSKSATKSKEITPKAVKSPPKGVTQSAPTNFTPYRLSLNKRLRETMTKKRLEFHIAQEKEKDQTSLTQDVDNDSINSGKSPKKASLTPSFGTPTTRIVNIVEEKKITKHGHNVDAQKRRKLIQQIEIVEEEMQARQRHISKTQELQGEINRWRHTFHHSITDLQQNIEPYQSKIMLARGLGIGENLLTIEDEDNE